MPEPNFRDDPAKDYRQRYHLPEQFLWDTAAFPRIDFDGYMSIVLDLLPESPANILDAGCGPGWGSKLMAERGHRVVGVDFNERGVAFARILVPEAEFHHCDLRLLKENTELHNCFDVATIIEVIEHIPPDYHDDVLAGVHRALRPGGRMILSVPSDRFPLNKWDYRRFSQQDVKELVEKNGFQVQKMILQHQRSWLFSRNLWRLLRNRYYDLRFARHLLRKRFLQAYNIASDPEKAGRFIIMAERR